MKVLILYDPIEPCFSPEAEDDLTQARAVSSALEELGMEPVVMGVRCHFEQLRRQLRPKDFGLIFNLIESLDGKGRLIHVVPALLEIFRVPYTGASADSLYLTCNKVVAKRLMALSGINTPPWLSPAGAGSAPWKGPSIIKSVWEHASLGLDEDSVLDIAESRMLLREMERRSTAHGGEFFAEAYIEGREFNVGLLADEDGVQILPPAEIVFDGYGRKKRKVIGYRAKWDEKSFEYRSTRRRFDLPSSDAALAEKICRMARDCWDLFHLRGYARVDFRVDRNRTPWVLEVNANPCISHDAGFTAAAARAGIPLVRVVERIVQDALRDAVGELPRAEGEGLVR